jgi:RNA polymerase sigma factor (TIGR02999 family)
VTSPHDTTRILNKIGAGDASAADRLLPLVYEELRRLAAHYMLQERPGHTLQPTALVNEAYLRLVDQSRVSWRNREQFFAVAAEMIRRILVDHARKKSAAKRGGGAPHFPLDLGQPGDATTGQLDLLALDDALTRLGELSDRQRRVVELRFFGGLSVQETANALEVSKATVKNDWRVARAWLQGELGD